MLKRKNSRMEVRFKTMYENNSSYNNYSFSQDGTNRDGQYGAVPPLKPSNDDMNKKSHSSVVNYLKKALLCASLGLFFGLCAGLGIYAVNQTTQQVESTITNNREELEQDTVQNSSVVNSDSVEVNKMPITVVDSSITSVVNQVMPSMVSIGNEFTERYSYFGQSFEQEEKAAGSGIVVGENDSELLIVTNYHVIANADKLTVTFIDNTEAEAQLKGADASMDLAVLAVPLSDLSNVTRNKVIVAKLGDSESLQLGEPVIAIGNALGYGQSVTNGIVSALNREVELSDGQTGVFIQTNAAINPGNSGGALLNIKGEVIGINSNKLGGDIVEGMGYAIPISKAKPIISELMARETKLKVQDDKIGFIGIQPATVTPEISMLYGMPQGVFITNVIENSPALEAGLLKGDIITHVDGTKVTSFEELQEEMQYHASGDTIKIKVQRNGLNGYEEKEFDITLTSRED